MTHAICNAGHEWNKSSKLALVMNDNIKRMYFGLTMVPVEVCASCGLVRVSPDALSEIQDA